MGQGGTVLKQKFEIPSVDSKAPGRHLCLEAFYAKWSKLYLQKGLIRLNLSSEVNLKTCCEWICFWKYTEMKASSSLENSVKSG